MIHQDAKIWGVTSIGERGQVVIPAKLREELKIQKGEEFVVVCREKSKAIMLVPESTMTGMLKGTLEQIEGYKGTSKTKNNN